MQGVPLLTGQECLLFHAPGILLVLGRLILRTLLRRVVCKLLTLDFSFFLLPCFGSVASTSLDPLALVPGLFSTSPVVHLIPNATIPMTIGSYRFGSPIIRTSQPRQLSRQANRSILSAVLCRVVRRLRQASLAVRTFGI